MTEKRRKIQDKNQGKNNAQRSGPERKPAPTAVTPREPLDLLLRRAELSPDSLTPKDMVQLQRTIGNQAVGQLGDESKRATLAIQAKLTLGPVGDKYEQEADRMAKQVSRQTAQRQEEEEELQMKPADSLQRQEEEEEVMMKPASILAGGEVDADVEASIQAARGGGAPLVDQVRSPMENAFGADFSGVKVHTGGESDALNQTLQARAFTTGQDIFFRQGEYNPGSSAGQELLAHELTHVVQQSGSQVQRVEDTIQREDDPETGLARSKSIEKFGGKVKAVIDDWANLAPATRMNGLISAVNVELSKARVPGVKGLAEDCGGAGNALFDFTTWTVKVDPTSLNQGSVTSAEAAELADAIYHESRHAKQWYRIARLRAGEGLAANQLARELFIPANIASQAAGDPLKPLSAETRRVRSRQFVELHDQTLKEAKEWYKSIYGEDSAHRNEVLGDIDNRYADYRALAEEVDAWAIGGRAQTVVTNLLSG